jgi:uncharacterized protein YkwD
MRPVALVLCTLSAVLVLAASAPAAQAGGPRLDGAERTVVRAVNRARARYGLARLRAVRSLSRAADHHSWEMLAANYFAHVSSNGGSMGRRVRRFARYRHVGEVLARTRRCGRRSARRAVRMWLRSPAHRGVLLSRRYRRIGVGARGGRLGALRACVVTADLASRR